MIHSRLFVALLASALPSVAQESGAPDRHIAVYDVRDWLAAPVAAEPAPAAAARGEAPFLSELPLLGRLFEERKAEQAAAAPEPGAGAEAIADLVRAFCRPPMGPDDDVAVVAGHALAVQATGEQHAWITRFLARHRVAEPQATGITFRLFRCSHVAFIACVQPVLQQEATRRGVAVAEVEAAVLAPGAETEAFLAGLADAKEVDALVAPKLTVLPLHQATVSCGNQVSYVRDFAVEVANTSMIADPVIDVVHEGIEISAMSARGEGDDTWLALDVADAELQRPIATLETKLAGFAVPVTIQLPRVTVRRVQAAVDLPPGHTALLVLSASATGRSVAVVSVESVETARRR